MKNTLYLSLALFVATQVAIVSPAAFAAESDQPDKKVNVWTAHNPVNRVFNFKMSNGDVVIVKQNHLMTQNARVQVRRKGKSRASASSVESVGGILQFAGPERFFQGANADLIDGYRVQFLGEGPTQIKLFYVKGDYGLMVIGQVNQARPAAYFTYLIPNADLNDVPLTHMSYILPAANGASVAQAKSIDLGIFLGLKNGRVLRRALRVNFHPNRILEDGPANAVRRPMSGQDERYLEIPFANGAFKVPPELANQFASAKLFENGSELTGVDKYRANSQSGDGLLSALKLRIFGQDEALSRIVFHYQKMLAAPMKKPKVLVFMGPSGVGKTYTGQEIAKQLYGGTDRFLEVPGNEYNAHAGALESSKLFGSPTGVRNPTEGSLVTWLKSLKGEGGLLLINEGDKMHPEIWMKFMELLDQGKLTVNDGSIVTTKNLLIAITTNRGATRMYPAAVADWSQADIDKRAASLDKNTLKGYYLAKEGLRDENTLPREVINRIDDFIPYGPFSKEAAVYVARVAARELAREYEDEYLVTVKIDDDAIEQMALIGWTPADDARQIREQVSSAVLRAVDTAVHKLDVQNGQTINVTFDRTDVRKHGYRVRVGETSTMIDGKQVLSTNPLLNDDLKKQLLGIDGLMKKQVIGQDTTVTNVADAVVSHAMRPDKNRPLVVGLIGVSGNGKTETARALANARYGGRISIISMGEISSSSDFDKKFGSAAQMQGGDIARDFEVALKNNPDGGVIVLDEISNMGGGHPEARAALLMKLYGIFEEGIFTSPVDNKVFQLDKYVFILTGNESEGLFANVTSDDMLKATWEDNRAPEKVRAQLNSARYPQAFINRVKWFLMKPLLSDEVHTVTKKLWDRDADAFMRKNSGLKITTGLNFFDRVSVAYFTPDKGGRAVRDIFEDKIGNLLLRTLDSSGLDTSDLRDVEVRFDLVDNRLTTPYVTTASPEREVAFKATVIKSGTEVHSMTIDATDLAAQQMLLGKDSARAVSFHEMGHGAFEGLTPEMLKSLGYEAVRLSEITGMELQYVTIRGGRMGDLHYYGYARSAPIKGAMLNPTHDRVVLMIAQLWAGSHAQELAGYPKDAGWGNDLEKIRKVATAYFTKWGLDRDFVGIPVNEKGEAAVPPALAKLFEQRMNALLKEGEELADQVIRLRWDFISGAADELMNKGEISIERMHEIDKQVTAMSLSEKKAKWTLPTSPGRKGSRRTLTCEAAFAS